MFELDSWRFIDWTVATLYTLAFICYFGILITIRIKTGRLQIAWPFQIHNRFRDTVIVASGSIIFSSLVMGISLELADYLLAHSEGKWQALLSSPGILAATIAAFFTVWGFLNTFIIRSAQEERIADIPSIIRKACAELEPYARGSKKLHAFYMVDYDPGIGIKYADEESYDFRERLSSVCNMRRHATPVASSNEGNVAVTEASEVDQSSVIHLVFYTDKMIQDYHDRIRTSPKQLQGILHCIRDIERSSQSVAAVWRSDEIGPLHYIMVNDVVFQYIVIPEEEKNKSVAIGMRSEDAFLISFLKETITYTITKAITPKCARRDGSIVLEFSSQDYIKRIDIYLSETEQVMKDDLPTTNIEISDEKMPAEIVISEEELNKTPISSSNVKSLKVRLIKKNSIQSPLSELVKVPPI